MAPISNDLLLAAALTSAVPGALAQTLADTNRSRTGVATTVTTNAARGATSTTMYIDGTSGQRLATDANSTIHVLFSDQSAVTVGPNSELVIAKYEFDPKAKNGQILIDLTKGLLRVVGGLISKKAETVVRTSTATIGIRGGISSISHDGGQTTSRFHFGKSLKVTDNNRLFQTINRPGFQIISDPDGVSPPMRIPSDNPAQPRQSGPPASGFAYNQSLWQIPFLSSTRMSDPDIKNPLLLNSGGNGGTSGGGAPNLNTLLGSPTPGNNS